MDQEEIAVTHDECVFIKECLVVKRVAAFRAVCVALVAWDTENGEMSGPISSASVGLALASDRFCAVAPIVEQARAALAAE